MRRLVLALPLMLALGACRSGIDTAEWTEEVRLSDGKTVVVWRKARAYSNGFPNAPRGGWVDVEFAYKPMQVHYKSTFRHDYYRNPMAFDVIDGVAYLVVRALDEGFCVGRPKLHYTAQFLRWSEGQWIEVPQEQFPLERVQVNLYTDYWGHTSADDAKGLITWEMNFPNGRKPRSIKDEFEATGWNCQMLLKE